MKNRIALLVLAVLLVSLVPLLAQDATLTPEEVTFPYEFPLDMPTDNLLAEAHACILDPDVDPTTSTLTCELARQALALKKDRGDDETLSPKEIELVQKLVGANPALALRLDVIAAYYSAVPLVAPPAFTVDNPITKLHLTYTFAGLGNGVAYELTITQADGNPVVKGDLGEPVSGFDMPSPTGTPPPTSTPRALADTVDSQLVQAFAPALRDLLPIGHMFTSTPCWDYYPDWEVELTFADKTVVKMVTNQSNVVGLGGPWQTEIDGQVYMQYSGAFQTAIVDLFDALDLPFGQTAAMGCGGMNEPLDDAFSSTVSNG
ncbi:MAG: hypothetical protein R3E39_20575 [Anaerolineae bacterium]